MFIDKGNTNNPHTSARKRGSLLLIRGLPIGILHLCDNKAHWDREFNVFDEITRKHEPYSFKFSNFRYEEI